MKDYTDDETFAVEFQLFVKHLAIECNWQVHNDTYAGKFTGCAPPIRQRHVQTSHVTRGFPSLPIFVHRRAYLSVPAQAC